MVLQFALTDNIRRYLTGRTKNLSGKVTVQLDPQRRASLVALKQQQPLQANQLQLQFRLRNGQVKFATNAFFFQEGSGAVYEQAKYGLFRVGASGQLLLTHLLDAELQSLGQTQTLQPATVY